MTRVYAAEGLACCLHQSELPEIWATEPARLLLLEELVSFPAGLFSPVSKRRIPHLSVCAKLAFLSAGLRGDPPSSSPRFSHHRLHHASFCPFLDPPSASRHARSLPVSLRLRWGVSPLPPHPCSLLARRGAGCLSLHFHPLQLVSVACVCPHSRVALATVSFHLSPT